MIKDLVEQYEVSQTKNINLVASENVCSPDVLKILNSDLNHRYCIPPEEMRPAGLWDYPNQEIPRKIFNTTAKLACNLFKGSVADIRPLSGNQVASIILTKLANKGDNVWSVPSNCGGHFATKAIAKSHGIKLHDIPFDFKTGEIDIDRVSQLYQQVKPKLIFLDSSMIIKPYLLQELRKIVGEETIISYDASHVLGLIAGGTFQSPLEEGADLVHGSTHKSLWGPQKAIIVFKEQGETADKVLDTVLPEFVSSVHMHHVAALGAALEEHAEFGYDYSCAVKRNVDALTNSLVKFGLPPLFSDQFSSFSHQVIVPVGSKDKALQAMARLESIGVNLNVINIPFKEGYGFRIGLTEITRRGYTPDDVDFIGEILVKVTHGNVDLDEVQKEVISLALSKTEIYFTFK
ncbi:putative Serine hydroxymethyltransferase [Xenorhabdus bovienii str. kraussei Quebec]|uniref:Putative Serine hydroxymethyltransferase n=1 Tax=Xenorhabdus bovienii str. kraussei Quebec TaxID=1398203 RepID=A0A077PI98_XENBV|nr:hypothetical protein [Xenorhabdus bovienii]CDH20372.1 putative Serine hydroxymethyltransferase [Xenorhabdus bovienii str. kraussei Quebec]